MKLKRHYSDSDIFTRNSGLVRLVFFLVGIFCSLYVRDAIYNGWLNVTVGKHTNVVITQASDPAVFWGIVIFFSLIAVTLIFGAIFAKNKPRRG